MKVSAYFFDLDNTLIDSEMLWVAALLDMLSDDGFSMTREEATKVVLGRAWTEIYGDFAKRFPHLAIGADALAKRVRPYFEKRSASADIAIYPSVETLKRVARTTPTAIVSGSPHDDVVLAAKRLCVYDKLQFVIGAEDYARGKPDPSCYLMAARKLGVNPSECVVFEDSTAGVAAAKAAKMLCVALARPDAPKQDVSAADVILDSLAFWDESLPDGDGRRGAPSPAPIEPYRSESARAPGAAAMPEAAGAASAAPKIDGQSIFCQKCGMRNRENNYKCTKCGALLHRAPPPASYGDGAGGYVDGGIHYVPAWGGDGTFGGLIPAGNPKALGAYYLSIASLIPVMGLPFAMVAIVMGFQALKFRRANPSVRGSLHARFGIALSFVGLAINLMIIAAFLSQQ